jgi:hypothetical protein
VAWALARSNPVTILQVVIEDSQAAHAPARIEECSQALLMPARLSFSLTVVGLTLLGLAAAGLLWGAADSLVESALACLSAVGGLLLCALSGRQLVDPIVFYPGERLVSVYRKGQWSHAAEAAEIKLSQFDWTSKLKLLIVSLVLCYTVIEVGPESIRAGGDKLATLLLLLLPLTLLVIESTRQTFLHGHMSLPFPNGKVRTFDISQGDLDEILRRLN